MTGCSENCLSLRSWRQVTRNTLRGFAAVTLSNGLEIEDIPVHVSHGRAWATLPARPVLDADGRQVEIGGKKQWAALMRWHDREATARFSDAVVELISAFAPDALSDPGGDR